MLSPHRKNDFMIKTIEALSGPIAPAPAPRNRVSYPASVTQTSVELTFSFGIASMQLTPTFQIGALQLRPISNVVTMRLAPSQQPQSAVNLQLTLEIAKFQPTFGGFGIVRLVPSQRQRPNIVHPLSFDVAGLQLVSNFEAAPVQVTPSQQASVVVTGSFQIASVEFSPSFELASIILNSSAKEVAVQLPGAYSVEGAVRFEIAHVQLGSSGEIGMMQLNLLDQGPTRSPQVYNSRRVANAIETERLENALCNVIKPAAIDAWMRTASLSLEAAHQ
jgi:hypothetical protein